MPPHEDERQQEEERGVDDRDGEQQQQDPLADRVLGVDDPSIGSKMSRRTSSNGEKCQKNGRVVGDRVDLERVAATIAVDFLGGARREPARPGGREPESGRARRPPRASGTSVRPFGERLDLRRA